MPGTRIGGRQADESCGPFESSDRAQPAANFRRMLATVVRDAGIAGGVNDELEIVPSNPTGLNFTVSTGSALLGDPEDELYTYDNPTAFVFDDFTDPDDTDSLILRVGLLLDASTGELSGGVAVIEGTAASTPVRPAHGKAQTSEEYWIDLADIELEANATEIVASNITDQRDDSYIERTTFDTLNATLRTNISISKTIDNALNRITLSANTKIIIDTASILAIADRTNEATIDEIIANGTLIATDVLRTSVIQLGYYEDDSSSGEINHQVIAGTLDSTEDTDAARQLFFDGSTVTNNKLLLRTALQNGNIYAMKQETNTTFAAHDNYLLIIER